MKLRYKLLNGFLACIAVAILALGVVLSHTKDCVPAAEVSLDTVTMQAVVYRCYGSPDVLNVEVVARPVPAGDEVLVKVVAASVNPLDWHYMRGSPYFMRLSAGLGAPEDTRVGVDFAGTIEAVGENVSRFKVGDEVFGGSSGAFAEYVTVRQSRGLALKPAGVTFEEAAAVPIAAITALQSLRDVGKLAAGQKVLINGASGGVGTFAVQIAKAYGAQVTGVCSTRNIDMVRSLGADHVIDYKKTDYTKSTEQYDLIVDMVGNHSVSANRGVLTEQGILAMVGGGSGDWIGPALNPLKALLMSRFVEHELAMVLAELNQEDMTALAGLMEAGKVTSVIDRRFPLSEVRSAIRYSESGRARGKIVVNVSESASGG